MTEIGRLAQAILDGDIEAAGPLLDMLRQEGDRRTDKFEDMLRSLVRGVLGGNEERFRDFRRKVNELFIFDIVPLPEALKNFRKTMDSSQQRTVLPEGRRLIIQSGAISSTLTYAPYVPGGFSGAYEPGEGD